MNQKKLYMTAAVLSVALVSTLIWAYTSRFAGDHTPTTAEFRNLNGETVTVLFDSAEQAAILTGVGYADLMLYQVISASGARYANEQEGIEIWNKGNELTIYKGGEVLFVGADLPAGETPEDLYVFAGPTWVWHETLLNSGEVVRPNKPGAFTIKFDAEQGTVFGTTDCNSFSAPYTSGTANVLTFGPFMSTLMFCEGSQEPEFRRMVEDSNQYTFTPSGDLVLMIKFDSGSVIFKKQ